MRRIRRSSGLLLGALVFGSGVAPREAAKIPVLVISGANNHDWEWTHESLRAILADSGKFDVDLTLDPSQTLADAAGLARYQAFVLDYNGPRFGDAAEKNFLAAVRTGTGVAVIHAANNAFPGWVEYEKLVGRMWRDGTGHGKFHEFHVNVIDRDHPITRDLADFGRHPDELYHRLVRMHGAQPRVLATAFSAAETGGTGENEPMILVDQYGQGRVFHTPLGHVWRGSEDSRRSHLDPPFRALVVRGTEWAATGRVTHGGRPAPAEIRLLHEQDLDGWTAHLEDGGKLEDVWTVDQGVLVCKGRPIGYLRTRNDYQNFILRLEWRFNPVTKVAGNSGVLLRMIGEDKVWPRSIEAQLQSGRAGDFWNIDEFPMAAAKDRTEGRHTAHTHAHEKPVGEWNQYEITANGGHVTLKVNGEVLNEAFDCLETPGKICLQSEGAEIHFRNIYLLPLPASSGS